MSARQPEADTCIRLWNPAAERIFGWTAAEMVGRGGLPMGGSLEVVSPAGVGTSLRAAIPGDM